MVTEEKIIHLFLSCMIGNVSFSQEDEQKKQNRKKLAEDGWLNGF